MTDVKMRWKTKCFHTGCEDCCAVPSGTSAMWYLVLAMAGIAAFWKMIPIPLQIRNWALLCVLIDVSISDIRNRIIPNRSIIAGILLWCMGMFRIGGMSTVFLPWTEAASNIAAASAISILCFFLAVIFKRIRKHTVLGGGDIKLFFLGGLLLGPVHSLYMILIAGILGLLTAVLMHAFSGKKPIPFGPAIAFAIAALLFCS